ncbi:MAG: M1 family peptidase, partial [Bacteroidota bacterium]
MKSILHTLFYFLFLLTTLNAQVGTYDSGGPLMPEQAAYDVLFYHLNLEILPDKRRIDGYVDVRAKIVHPTNVLVLDLDRALKVTEVADVKDGLEALSFSRKDGKIWIQLGTTQQRNTEVEIRVSYNGRPREAPNPPWDGGFTWEQTLSGAHWIATSCQTQGADLWWPNKDHVSDEPDSMALTIHVPDPLFVATNGKFLGKKPYREGVSTYEWYISTPINNYNVALNIAPYIELKEEMQSVAGDQIPVVFYVLPEDEAEGKKLMPEILEHLAFYEKYLGPYPFRQDKYGVVQTPHLGMEHQTIIAYGANFNNGS